jgi:hypothetical protein
MAETLLFGSAVTIPLVAAAAWVGGESSDEVVLVGVRRKKL